MNSFNEVGLAIDDINFLRNKFCRPGYIFNINMFLAELIFFGLVCFFIFVLNLLSGGEVNSEFISSLIIAPILLSIASWIILTVFPNLFTYIIISWIINSNKKYSIIGSPTNYDKEALLLDETDPYGQQFMKFKFNNQTYRFRINEHSDELTYIKNGRQFKIDFVSKFFIFQELSRKRISQ